MKDITKEDCKNLYNDFINYIKENKIEDKNTINLIFFYNTYIRQVIIHFNQTSQRELRSMFRNVLKLIKKDYSDYEEDIYETNNIVS